MLDPNKNKNTGTDSNPESADQQAGQDIKKENENVAAAYKEASKDIEDDPEFSAGSPNDDLDEGESARLGENTGLI